MSATLPAPDASGVDHIVVVTMENRSLDHLLGWYAPAGGRQNFTYLDSTGQPHDTFHLMDFQGCDHSDPDHSYEGGRVEYDNGLCDGWLRAGANDIFSIGYYTQSDLAFLGRAVPAWTTFSRYFAATMAETYPNRFYQHAAQTDRIANTNTISALPTIWDELAAAKVDGRYYYSDVPFLALWGAKYIPIARPFAQFLLDCATNDLPSVAYVDPRFLGEQQGISGDDHPHADIRDGEAFMWMVYEAVTRSLAWPRTVLIFTFDEWGGFFDHVPPQTAPDANPANALRGFRVPCLAASPFARRGFIATDVYDHTSILNMIEWRWNLPPLTPRDAAANNLASAFDFTRRNVSAPHFFVPPGPFGHRCVSLPAPLSTEWDALLALARQFHWPV